MKLINENVTKHKLFSIFMAISSQFLVQQLNVAKSNNIIITVHTLNQCVSKIENSTSFMTAFEG